MNMKFLIVASVVSMMAACNGAPADMIYYDSEMIQYRDFLSDLDRRVSTMAYQNSGSTSDFDILQLRDEINYVIGDARSFNEFSYAQYVEFRSLTNELYRRLCSAQPFVEQRAILYDLLVSHDIGHQIASID